MIIVIDMYEVEPKSKIKKMTKEEAKWFEMIEDLEDVGGE